MKRILLIIIGIVILIIGIIGTMSILYAYQLPHYSLEIQGMKDTYLIGEEYSFYYTLSGYGHTCGVWLVWYPDQKGDVIPKGEVLDCSRPTNKEFSFNSEKFTSIMPDTAGIYNVTVSVSKIKEPTVFEFEVIPKNKSDVIDSLKIPNAERDAKLAAGYKLYPGVGWVHPDDQGNQHPIYRDNPNNPGELILDIDAMIKVEKSERLIQVLRLCEDTEARYLGALSFENSTHHIDSQTCTWQLLDEN